jgi:Spy/CpxP family protein refolding chaperone
MKKKLLIVAVMLVLSASLFLNAQEDFSGMGPRRARHDKGLFADQDFIPVRLLLKTKDKIGLNPEQEKKLSAMGEAHEQWLIKFRADMQIKALKLRSTLDAEPLNMKDAEGLIRAQADMHAEMQIARMHFQQEVKSVLTAEQLDKLSEWKKEFRGRVRDGMRQRREGRRERAN